MEKVNNFLLEKKYKRKLKKKKRKLMVSMPGGGTDFPPLPKPDNMPVIINSPPV